MVNIAFKGLEGMTYTGILWLVMSVAGLLHTLYPTFGTFTQVDDISCFACKENFAEYFAQNLSQELPDPLLPSVINLLDEI